MHVVLLTGGTSGESSGTAVSAPMIIPALERLGHQVTSVHQGDDIIPVARAIAEAAPDVVLNSLYGGTGEDGCIQGLLEILGVPYTHSGVAASAIGLNKYLTKLLLKPRGVPLAPGRVVSSSELFAADPLPRPYVLKPLASGSSLDLVLVAEDSPFGNPIRADVEGPWHSHTELLAEAYIPGRDLTAGVLRNRFLAITENIPKSGFLDFHSKYTPGQTESVTPADIPAEVQAAIMKWTLEAHRTLGCRGITRSDFRYDDRRPGTEGLFLLEVNTQPGITTRSYVIDQAKANGLSYDDVLQELLDDAIENHQNKQKQNLTK